MTLHSPQCIKKIMHCTEVKKKHQIGDNERKSAQTAEHYRMRVFFFCFFAMFVWNLCLLVGTNGIKGIPNAECVFDCLSVHCPLFALKIAFAISPELGAQKRAIHTHLLRAHCILFIDHVIAVVTGTSLLNWKTKRKCMLKRMSLALYHYLQAALMKLFMSIARATESHIT